MSEHVKYLQKRCSLITEYRDLLQDDDRSKAQFEVFFATEINNIKSTLHCALPVYHDLLRKRIFECELQRHLKLRDLVKMCTTYIEWEFYPGGSMLCTHLFDCDVCKRSKPSDANEINQGIISDLADLLHQFEALDNYIKLRRRNAQERRSFCVIS